MFKSYYFLNRLTLELNNKLSGMKIIEIFSQEKDKLIIRFSPITDEQIEISVNHGEPYLNLRNNFARAKRNTLDFFSELIGSKILNIEIADNDRVIKIETTNGTLYFAIRGKYTNLFYLYNDNLVSFKNEKEEILYKVKKEFSHKSFINYFNSINDHTLVNHSIEKLKETFPFIGAEIYKEVLANQSINKSDYIVLQDIIEKVKQNNLVIIEDDHNFTVDLGIRGFVIHNQKISEQYSSCIAALTQFLKIKKITQLKSEKIKRINSYLNKETNRILDKLNNLRVIIEKGPDEAYFKKLGNLLLININESALALSSIKVEDIYDLENPGNMISIKLDKSLSIKKNAEIYFEKSKESKTSYEKTKQLYLESKKKYELLKSYQQKITSTITFDEILTIMKELKIKEDDNETGKDNFSLKFKHYLIENKYHVFVGKDSQNNDILTTKFAKQNDYWFHVRSVSGSHVVLRVENNKEIIPKNILKKAASLAGYHSKAKTAGVVPVSFTLKKYVIKRKGMPPGQVALLKEEVLLIKPEIADGCEYLTE